MHQDSEPAVVSLGNLHTVFFVPGLHAVSAEEVGPHFEQHGFFPDGCNVEIVQVHSPTRIQMRVWERGAGVTPACGSGACAAFAAAYRNGRVEERVTVMMEGGDLVLEQTQRSHLDGRAGILCMFGVLDRSLLHD